MIRLIGRLWALSGDKLTHPWDANSYLVDGDEPALIDCGSSQGYAALKSQLKSGGYEPRHIRRVIATHGHWDHLSGTAQLREDSDALLYLHPAEHEAVESGDPDLTAAFLYGKAFPPVAADVALNDGDALDLGEYRLHVYHTPGHSPGSVCLWMEINGLKLLVAADTLYGAYHPRMGSDLDTWQASLDRLLTLDFDVMTIGHATPTLIFDAKRKVMQARQQFGVAFDPWFKPFYTLTRY